MQQQLDKELAALFKAGSPEALERIYNMYYERLWCFAGKILGKGHQPEDIVIEVFANSWQRHAQIELSASYLYRAVHNACINVLMKEKREQTGKKALTDIMESAEDTFQTNENEAVEAEMLQFIYSQVDNLPEKLREVFRLTYNDHLSTSEIAKKRGLSVKTIRTQKNEAIERLQKAIKARFK